jgi:toxin ParE1/3/4
MFELWAYIAKDNVSAADRMVARIEKTIAKLAHFPHLGDLREYRSRELRQLTVPPYVVIYQHQSDEVTVMRVVHSSREWEELL